MLLLESQHDKAIANPVNLACTAVHKAYVHLSDKLPHNILSLVVTIDTQHEPVSYIPTFKINQCNACRTLYAAVLQHGGIQNIACQLMTAMCNEAIAASLRP